MAQRIDLARLVKDILKHTGPMPAEEGVPRAHYQRSVRETWGMLEYLEQHIATEALSKAVLRRHMTQLFRMMLAQIIETFERFLKELAAVCVDHLAEFVLDKRFDEWQVRGGVLVAHFQAGTVGKALCESDTWLDCKDINDRFRKVLSDPFEMGGTFYAFPSGNQQPAEERPRFAILNTLWQVRHTIVHNVGVITRSDAVKFRLLTQEPVTSPCVIQPTRDDVRHTRRFLDESAEIVNRRVGERLAELLTTIRADQVAPFDAQERANLLTLQFGRALTLAGATGALLAT